MSIYLKSLEISGFKSFGTKTYIEFSEGITGIVGPNGCGKSNVVESMKWVLGEQSAKSLRGDKMQDIIFAGTRHRSASGMADVSLTFNNETHWLPLEFSEVSIGRRVFRSGEGQYFVNKSRVRMRDTTELFLDTGVGKDSYAIFEQGKIDRLLSESAEERRILFEDFAGISKFKFRKEEAEKKLAQARENLERLQETIDRLEKETISLELQASDAENYNVLNAELREMEVKFEVARIHNMKREIARREDEILKLKESLNPLTEKLNDIENQMLLSDQSLGEKEVLFGQINEKNIKLEKELSENKIRCESAQKNLQESKIRLQEMEIRARQNQERKEEWEDILLEKQDGVADAQKKQEQAKKILDNAEEISSSLKNQSSALEEKLLLSSQEHGFKKSLTRDDVDQLRTVISELQAQIYVQESKIITLENDLTTKKQNLIEEQVIFQGFQTQLHAIKKEEEITTLAKQEQNLIISKTEQEISHLGQEYKKAMEESKRCDQLILNNMNQQIAQFKNFQQDLPDRKETLNSLLHKIQTLIESESTIKLSLFQELQQSILSYEKAYTTLLKDLFGEEGSFSPKIALSEQIDLINSQLEDLRSRLSSQRQEFDVLLVQETSVVQKMAEIRSHHNASEKELSKIEKTLSSLTQQITQAQTVFALEQSQMTTNRSKLEKTEEIVTHYDKELQNIRNQHYEFQNELTQARIHYNNTQTQAQALLSDIKSLEDRIADLDKQISHSHSDKLQLSKSISNLEEEIEDLIVEQDEIQPELSKIQKDMEQHFIDIADLRQTKKVLEQMHKEGIEQFTKLRMRESEIEGSLSERKTTLETMKTNLQEQFHINDSDIVLEKEESTEFLNNQIRLSREKLNQMGNVNLLAIEQFQATKEQHAYLIYQKEDIEAATTDTEMLINDTNKESAERFMIAFEQIRQSFRKLFSELFNGGRADLTLKDESDPLRSGINIMAEPPGQKFQNVSLLSGGQRAMVAIAVIFSILELKPTPFVILDEMDAPLDDENIDRFKKLLVRFKGTSQFVVVSHSKSTLEVCDVLFGVTMEELGCSKIVSVAFDDTENLLFTQ